MKKILFITPYLPSLKAGGEKFTYLLLESLSKENYIDLVYFKYRGDAFYSPSNSNISVLKVLDNSLVVKLCHAIQHPLTHPIFTVRFDRKLLSLLRELVFKNNYDLFYIDHTQMFMYGKYFPELRKILMAHDVMAQRYSRRGSWLSRKMILNKEKEFVQMPNSTVFTFSEKDNDIIKSNYGITAYSTNFFLDNMILKSSPQTIKQRIVLMGKWDRLDNLDGLKWFLEQVCPNIDKRLKIVIFGKGMPSEMLKRINEFENIEYLGFVEDPYEIISNSKALISPLFTGAGVKVKVVESLACGTPVVGTDIAFEGISSDFSSFMKKAYTPNEFSGLINELSVSIAERRNFKELFWRQYHNQNIVSYINIM